MHSNNSLRLPPKLHSTWPHMTGSHVLAGRCCICGPTGKKLVSSVSSPLVVVKLLYSIRLLVACSGYLWCVQTRVSTINYGLSPRKDMQERRCPIADPSNFGYKIYFSIASYLYMIFERTMNPNEKFIDKWYCQAFLDDALLDVAQMFSENQKCYYNRYNEW